MSPAAKLTAGWGVLIALAMLVLSLLSGWGGGMRSVGNVEARVKSLEECSIRHEVELGSARNQRNDIAKEYAGKVSELKTDVKYIVKAVDGLVVTVDDIKSEIRQQR